jgi:hypothetical protein
VPARNRLTPSSVAAAVSAGFGAWLSLGLLAVTDADRARRIGILPSGWLLVAFVVAALGAAAAVRLSRRASAPLFLPLLLAIPWLPLRIPAIFLVWTGHAVFFVWSGVFLCLSSLALSQRRTAPFTLARDPRVAAPAAGIAAFIVFLAVWSAQVLPPNGDEPHYLVIAQSLLLDRDLQVANNYERADYAPYYGGSLRPHFSMPGIGGAQYSVHAPGLPAFVAPAFALGGYRGVVFWIAACAAFGTFLVWRAGYLLTRDPGAAWFGWAATALTTPIALHGTLVYPDPIAGVILAAGALALVAANRPRPDSASIADRSAESWPPARSALLGLTIGSLPWLHTRLVVAAAVLAALIGLHLGLGLPSSRSRRRHMIAFLAPLLLLMGAWLAFFRVAYGTFNPAAPYGDQSPLEPRGILNGLLGLLFDQEFGLVANAPVHLLSLIGLGTIVRGSRRLGVELLAVVVPYAIVSSAFPMWWAGSSSPARFLVPVVFLLGVGAAALWAKQSSRSRALSATWLGASVLMAASLSFGGDGRLAYNASTGRARWLDWIEPLVDLPSGLPSFFRETAVRTFHGVPIELLRPTLCWAVALAAGWLLFIALDKGLPWFRRARMLTAPICLVLSCAGAVAASWGTFDGRVTATRAQLELLRGQDRAGRSLGLQLMPVRLLTPGEVTSRLSITTSPVDPQPRGALLYLEELPPGSYHLNLAGRASSRGAMTLGVGRATVPAARWLLAATETASLFLPVHAAFITVTGDEEAVRTIDNVSLTPDAQAEGRSGRVESSSAPWLAGPARARDAARYGSAVVYTLDDRVWLEPGGFWIMGGRSPTVVLATDQPVSSFPIDIRNGPGTNRVKVSAADWSSERELNASETWRVRVPASPQQRSQFVRFDVQRGFVPAELDSTSTDRRALGCWVELR